VAVLTAIALVVRPRHRRGSPSSRPGQQAHHQGRQSAANGNGGAGCVTGQLGVGPSAPGLLPTGPVSKVRRMAVSPGPQCYEWADGSVTQTPDPQSPPCVADWPRTAEGNGGALAAGFA